MSEKTHGGSVYLSRLFQDFKEEDRSKINLLTANFSKASLMFANFSKASLVFADFSEADLCLAKFQGSVLVKADFSGAHLECADFSGADLGRANFFGADIFGANFSGAHLEGANFSGNKPFDDKGFIDCYCSFDNDFLPKPPLGYKFEFENRTDENNQPIYPENNENYRYIKLIKLK